MEWDMAVIKPNFDVPVRKLHKNQVCALKKTK